MFPLILSTQLFWPNHRFLGDKKFPMHLLTWSQVDPFFWTLLPQAEPMSESVFQTPHKTYSQPRGKTPIPSIHVCPSIFPTSSWVSSLQVRIPSFLTYDGSLPNDYHCVPANRAGNRGLNFWRNHPAALLGSWCARVGWDVNRFTTFSNDYLDVPGS